MPKNLRPFDLTKLDFEAVRHQKRRKLVLYSLPVVVIATVAVWWLVWPIIATSVAMIHERSGDYESAGWWLGSAAINTVFEHYKQPLNLGIIATQQKQYDVASDYYRTALALAPQSQHCLIHVQAVLSSELAGDNRHNDTPRAIVYYTKALAEITTNKSCFKGYPDLAERIQVKLAAMEEQERAKNFDTTARSNTTDVVTDQQLQDAESLMEQGRVKRNELSHNTGTGGDSSVSPW